MTDSQSPPTKDDGWRKVLAPKAWRPAVGEILEGTYLGMKDAEGQHGPYKKYVVSEEKTTDPYFLSGTVADTLFTTSLVQPGMKVRLIFLGLVETANGAYKNYDMYVKDPST